MFFEFAKLTKDSVARYAGSDVVLQLLTQGSAALHPGLYSHRPPARAE
jgi:hypothetical protein